MSRNAKITFCTNNENVLSLLCVNILLTSISMIANQKWFFTSVQACHAQSVKDRDGANIEMDCVTMDSF